MPLDHYEKIGTLREALISKSEEGAPVVRRTQDGSSPVPTAASDKESIADARRYVRYADGAHIDNGSHRRRRAGVEETAGHQADNHRPKAMPVNHFEPPSHRLTRILTRTATLPLGTH